MFYVYLSCLNVLALINIIKTQAAIMLNNILLKQNHYYTSNLTRWYSFPENVYCLSVLYLFFIDS